MSPVEFHNLLIDVAMHQRRELLRTAARLHPQAKITQDTIDTLLAEFINAASARKGITFLLSARDVSPRIRDEGGPLA